MNRDDVPRTVRMLSVARALVALAAVLLLAPFLLLAVAPMLLMLGPVALIGIPMLVPALLYSSLGARSRERKRSSPRPGVRPATTGRLITR
jgi:hypothetical protein